MGRRRGSSGSGYIVDPKLVPRLQRLVARLQESEPYTQAEAERVRDAAGLAELLRDEYREYSRKPFDAFVRSVRRALGQVDVKDLPVEGGAMADSGSDGDSPVELVAYPDTNALNASLTATYARSTPSPAYVASLPRTPTFADPSAEPRLIPMSAAAGTPGGGGGMGGAGAYATPSPAAASASARRARKRRLEVERREDGRRPSSASQPRKRLKKSSDGDGWASGDEKPARRPRSIRSGNKIKYKDLGGISAVLQDVRELIEWPITHPELYEHLGVEPPRGILLHGPPGTGKTMLANAIANELGIPFLKVSGPELITGMSGASEQKIRELFEDARKQAPSLIFFDEIDAIAPKREQVQREMEKRIVAQLLTCMDDLTLNTERDDEDEEEEDEARAGQRPTVLVIGATNRPHVLDSALRRAGRFDREIAMGVPDVEARERIFQVIASKLTLSGDFSFRDIAKRTPGYVGADLQAITKEAAVIAVKRIFSQMDLSTPGAGERGASGRAGPSPSADTTATPAANPTTPSGEGSEETGGDERRDGRGDGQTRGAAALHDDLRARVEPLSREQLSHLSITMNDFVQAIKRVQPSAKREGFATVPDVSWNNVGALDNVRGELAMAIMEPIRRPNLFRRLGVSSPAGVLLFGPPGCGKTMLAKGIANESNCNFISVKGPELLNKYVGESERAIRLVFERARTSSPCVVFFDELDALAPRRAGDASSTASERVVNQLLTEMDGLDSRGDVFVIAATNRPDIIDPAMVRPGRLDKRLYVPLPSPEDRAAILRALTHRTPLAPDADLDVIGKDERCTRFSGADLSALVREASLACLSDYIEKNPEEEDDVLAGSGVGEGEGVGGESGAAGAADHMSLESVTSANALAVTREHFEWAMAKVRPSVSAEDELRYVMMAESQK